MKHAPLLALTLAACGGAPAPAPPPVASPPASSPPSAAVSAAPTPAAAPAPVRFVATPIPLPGATGPVSLDYLARDRAAGRVWIPAGDTGSVDVLDVATGKLTRIEGFQTAVRDAHGTKHVTGPSSVTLGEGVAYVGNRATSQICAVDLAQLTRGACVTLASAPDGLQYVAATKELWATTPEDKSLTILDAATPAKLTPKTKIALPGEPEGYAVDEGRGIFYTNLEDGDKTLAIDVKAHRVTATWDSKCGEKGPRGLALDAARGFLFVACTDQVEVLDAGHGGGLLSKLATGEGVDNIDYLEARGQVYAAAGKAGALTVAHVDDKGILTLVATAPTAPGTRVVVVGREGTAYVADGKQGRVLAMAPAP